MQFSLLAVLLFFMAWECSLVPSEKASLPDLERIELGARRFLACVALVQALPEKGILGWKGTVSMAEVFAGACGESAEDLPELSDHITPFHCAQVRNREGVIRDELFEIQASLAATEQGWEMRLEAGERFLRIVSPDLLAALLISHGLLPAGLRIDPGDSSGSISLRFRLSL